MHATARRVAFCLIAMSLIAIRMPRSAAVEAARSQAAAGDPSATYVGVAGCAAMACHGGTRSNERGEYTAWIQKDRHARAFLTLYDERSARIARNLGIERPDQHPTCLACHSTATGAGHGPRFTIEDGVSCEACHGPAQRWLAAHSRPDWKSLKAPDKYQSLGMTNTKDIAIRAQICAGCHVGAPGREVNHDLIAAGHPALVFELDTFTAHMPPHWRETPDKPPAFGAQAWAAGQSAALRQSLELLADRVRGGRWPEFAEFDCTACHHELRTPSWRQQSSDRAPGRLAWTNPHAQLVQRIASLSSKPPEKSEAIAEVRRLLARSDVPAAELAGAIDRAAGAATEISHELARLRWDMKNTGELLRSVTAETDAGQLDYAMAAQIAMAAGTLFEALVRATPANQTRAQADSARIRRRLDNLYDAVEDPSEFEPGRFVDALREFQAAFHTKQAQE